MFEFMLMKDGSVKVFAETMHANIIRDHIAQHDGVAYYWRSRTVQGTYWCYMSNEPDAISRIAEDVPDVIKFATLLV